MADIISRLKLESGEFDSKIKRASQELMAYSQHCRKTGLEMGFANKDAQQFAKSLGSMQVTATTARGKVSELSDAFVNLKAMYNQMTDAEKQGQFGKALNDSLEQLKTRVKQAKAELESVTKELDNGNGASVNMKSVLGELGGRLGMSSELMGTLTSGTIAYTAAIGGATTAVIAASKAWADYNSEMAKQRQVTTVTTGLKGEDAGRMTDSVRALVSVYDVDFREAVNAANTLMTQFGQTGDQAIELIRQGMQGMIQGDGPKLLSMIQQYAPSFRDAGISASQLVAIIQNSEGGIFTDQNMNAIVMGIKNLRLMTKATSDALAQLGIDGKKMSKDLSDGTLTIFDAMKQVMEQLQKVESGSQTAGEVMQAVFGRQGSVAGTKLAEAIATLNTNLEETKRQTGEVGDAYNELYDANVRLNKAIRDCFEYDGWEQMATGIKAKLVDALSNVVEVAGNVKSVFDDVKKADISEGVSKSTPRAVKELERLAKLAEVLWKRIRGEGGEGGKGIGTSDIDKRLQYISNGADRQEREKRYDDILAELQQKLNNIGKERKVTNTDGSTSFKKDSQEVQDQKRAALERRIEMLEKRRDSVVNRPDATTKKPITPISPTKPTGGKGGKSGKEEIVFADDSIMAQEKLVSELTQKWKTASAAVKNDYAKQLQEAKDKLAEMQRMPVVPGSMEDLKQQLKDAKQKTVDLIDERSKLTDPIEIALKDEDIAEARDKVKEIQDSLDKLNGKEYNVKLAFETGSMQLPVMPEGDTAMGEAMASNLTTSLVNAADNLDLSGFASSINNAMMEGAEDIDLSEYMQYMKNAMSEYIDEEEWPTVKLAIETGDFTVIDEFNEKLQKSAKKTAGGWKEATSAIGQLGGALQKIEDPGVKAVGTVIEAVATAALGFANASKGPFTNAWEWIAFAASGMATLITMISTIHSATGMANGGIVGRATGGFVPGTQYSGDNIMSNGGSLHLDAGELVLNRAQQGVLASELEGGAMQGMFMESYISGEDIRLVLNNNGRRTGRGEYVQSNSWSR